MNEMNSVGIGHYFLVLRRRWKTIVAFAVGGLLAVVVFLAFSPSPVAASTLVNVNVIVSDPFNPSRPASGLLDAATENQLASSFVVAEDAAESLNGADDAASLRDGVSVTTGTNATTVRISYKADTAERARSGADALADSYLRYRQSEADARKTKMIGQLQEQLDSLNEALGDTPAADRGPLSGRISSIENQISQLTAVDTTGGSVLTPATENEVETQPQTSTLLASGLLGGLVLGVITVFILNGLGRRVLDASDVERLDAGPVLARLKGHRGTIPALDADINAFRMIREKILAAAGPDFHSLAVIDTTKRAVSDVAPNLAVAFAQAGRNVELILLGLPEHHMQLLSDGLGLTTDPRTRDSEAKVMISAKVPRLKVVRPSRPDAHSGADDLVTGVVRRRAVSASDTLVVLALPPNASYASWLAASRLAGSATIVVELSETRKDDLAAAASETRDVGASLFGVVLLPNGRAVEGAGGPQHLASQSVDVPVRDAARVQG